ERNKTPIFSKDSFLTKEIEYLTKKGTRFVHKDGKVYTVADISEQTGQIILKAADGNILRSDPQKLATLAAKGFLVPEELIKESGRKVENKTIDQGQEDVVEDEESLEEVSSENFGPTYEDLTEWHLDENGETETQAKGRSERALEAEHSSMLDWYEGNYE